MKEKGFILMIVIFLLLLLAVTSVSLNMKSGMQAKMSVNQSLDVQSYFSQLAVIEQSLWKLEGDPAWRVPSGEDYTYPDPAVEPDPQKRITYNRKVFSPDAVSYPALAAYKDAVIFSVRLPNASTSVSKSFRYNIDTPFLIRTPRQVCVDSAGNIIFADTANHSIWKIDASTSAIVRIAGTGRSGFAGDGGPATQARLYSPRGVCIDGMGNIYIADTRNDRIRKIAAGFISTVAGIGVAGYSGDGGAATLAQLNNPYGVWVDASGDIYIADRDNHRIRKVAVATGIISTVVNTSGLPTDFLHPLGDGGLATAATLNSPRAVFVDSALNIYIADTNNNRIRRFTVGGTISTVAGNGTAGYAGDGGAATAAQLNGPHGVWLDASGNIYIADRDNSAIRKVTAADGKINTIVNTSGNSGYSGDGGAATLARIDSPNGVCVKSTGEVVISDTSNSCIRLVSVTNTITTQPMMTVGIALNSPEGAASYYNSAQEKLFIYIADQGNHRIRRIDTATNAIDTVAGTGSGGYNGDDQLATGRKINAPQGVSVDTAGNIYIADTNNNRIRKFTVGGNITTVAGNGSASYSGDNGLAVNAALNSPTGVAVDTSGNVYIADRDNNRIRRFTVGGTISTVAGNGNYGYSGDGGAATAAQLGNPQGVSVDGMGNIYIADTINNRIRKFTVGGTISTVAGNGTYGYGGDGGAATAAQLRNPRGVSVDGAGNIYIADTANHALRLVSIYTGAISTMAGTGTAGYNGDLQPAVGALLNSPGGVALGLAKASGRIFISDSGNDRIRVLYLKTVKELYGP